MASSDPKARRSCRRFRLLSLARYAQKAGSTNYMHATGNRLVHFTSSTSTLLHTRYV
jgi:hypothetical protein